ncbi:hypothetical protein CPLU01_06040 [Colletotrichum plurivorum]|uniref:Uncharacterized protein n=1 Tax=Colletotrichum plurivorum TaxID=2175906 RepID=A0A8H6KJC8_9PEZI|nr:hypothetical protein CPLU01_06040 [Colletotrichum plurivorum]
MPRNTAAFRVIRARQLLRFTLNLAEHDPQNELLRLVSGDDMRYAEWMNDMHAMGEDEERWPETWEQPGGSSFKVFLHRHFRGWAASKRAQGEYDGPAKGTRSQVAARRAAMKK